MNLNNYDIEHRDSIEEAILGGLLVDRSTEEIVLKHNLQPSDFRKIHHRQLFKSILDCWESGANADIVTISNFRPPEYKQNELGEMSSDWDYMNIEIMNKIASSAHLEHHIMHLKQYVLYDYWNSVAHVIGSLNWNMVDVLKIGDGIIDQYNNMFKRMSQGIQKNHGELDYEEEMKDKVLNNRAGISSNVTTGSSEIDDLFKGGMSASELIVLAGRPGMMKTTISLIIAWESAKRGNWVVFFSLEMPTNQLKNKIISLETGINYYDLKNGNLTDDQWSLAGQWSKRIDESRFTIISDMKHIDQLADKLRELSVAGMCDFAVFDYLQLITFTGTVLREGIVYITRMMKSLAKECYIPIMILSQLNRGVESRPNKRPYLSDLKESGSIEEDADIVIFPYNDAYYALNGDNPLPVAESEKWKVEFNIAKGRDIGRSNDLLLDVNPITLTIKPYNPSFL